MYRREEYYPELYTAAKERGDEPPQVAFADVGCGFGGMTIALAKEYPDKLVAGMEIRQKVSGVFIFLFYIMCVQA